MVVAAAVERSRGTPLDGRQQLEQAGTATAEKEGEKEGEEGEEGEEEEEEEVLCLTATCCLVSPPWSGNIGMCESPELCLFKNWAVQV